jgi:hypothetical protein
MSCVFQSVDPLPPSPPGECIPVPPRLWCGGRTHSPGGEGRGGSIVWKTQDTALYFTYIESSFDSVGYDTALLKVFVIYFLPVYFTKTEQSVTILAILYLHYKRIYNVFLQELTGLSFAF